MRWLQPLNAIFDFAQHLDERLLEDLADEEALEECVIEGYILIDLLSNVQALHDDLDAGIDIRYELLRDK